MIKKCLPAHFLYTYDSVVEIMIKTKIYFNLFISYFYVSQNN